MDATASRLLACPTTIYCDLQSELQSNSLACSRATVYRIPRLEWAAPLVRFQAAFLSASPSLVKISPCSGATRGKATRLAGDSAIIGALVCPTIASYRNSRRQQAFGRCGTGLVAFPRSRVQTFAKRSISGRATPSHEPPERILKKRPRFFHSANGSSPRIGKKLRFSCFSGCGWSFRDGSGAPSLFVQTS